VGDAVPGDVNLRRLAPSESRRLDAASHSKSNETALAAYTGRVRAQLLEREVELERHPDIGTLNLTVPDELFSAENWWV